MRIACPYCAAVLNPTGLKPGRFQPKCPGCGKPFVLIIEVQPLAPKPAAPEPAPKKRALSVEEHASLLLEGKNPDDYGALAPPERMPPEADPNVTRPSVPPAAGPKPAPKPLPDPNVTGDFTTADDAPPAKAPVPRKPKPVLQETVVRAPEPDGNATGDFTEAGASRPPHARPEPQQSVVRAPTADPNSTGDFTTPGPGVEYEPAGEATGEITSAGVGVSSIAQPAPRPLCPEPHRKARRAARGRRLRPRRRPAPARRVRGAQGAR
ncbi:MAG TPA: hypothetical protein VGE74_20275 [Gemmata sp.]